MSAVCTEWYRYRKIVKCTEKNRENIQNMGMHCEKCKKKTKRHCKMIHHDV